MIYPGVGGSFFVSFKSLFKANMQSAKKKFPDFDSLLVKGEVLKEISSDTVMCSFPSMLKVLKLSKRSFFKRSSCYLKKKSSHELLSLKKYCKATKLNIYKRCEEYHSELAKLKAHGAQLIKKLSKINSKSCKSAEAIRRSMVTSVRAHLLRPIGQVGREKIRKQLVERLTLISDLGSQCLELNWFCCEVGSVVRGPMTNRFREVGAVPSRSLIVRKDFALQVLIDYLLLCGFEKEQKSRGNFLFTATSMSVVNKAFGGAENMPNGRDPFLHINCIKGQNQWNLQRQVHGIPFDAPVVMDPRYAKVADLKNSIIQEMFGGVEHPSLQGKSKGQLVDQLIKHRIKARTYLGMLYIHNLVVTPDNSFEVHVFPSRNGCYRVKLWFRVKKDKVVFTLNQQPQRVTVY
jgi:hypothetical protein